MLVDKYVSGKEVEVDAICDGEEVFVDVYKRQGKSSPSEGVTRREPLLPRVTTALLSLAARRRSANSEGAGVGSRPKRTAASC